MYSRERGKIIDETISTALSERMFIVVLIGTLYRVEQWLRIAKVLRIASLVNRTTGMINISPLCATLST